MPLRRGARAPGEQTVTLRQALLDLLQGQRTQPHHRQLDGQRYPVELPAQPRHQVTVLVGQLKARQNICCAINEQLHRVVGGQHFGRSLLLRGLRDGHRENRHHLLPVDVQWLPARRQDPHVGTLPGNGIRQYRTVVHQVLAVVEHQENAPRPEVVDDRVECGTGRLVPQVQPLGHPVSQQRRLTQLGQFDEAHPIAERPLNGLGNPPGQPRLTDPPGPREGHQMGGRQHPLGISDLTATTDEAGDIRRQIADTPAYSGYGPRCHDVTLRPRRRKTIPRAFHGMSRFCLPAGRNCDDLYRSLPGFTNCES